MHLKMSSAKWRPFWLGLYVLIYVRSASLMWLGFSERNRHNRLGAFMTWPFLLKSMSPNCHCDVQHHVILDHDNTLRLTQDGRHSADDIFKCIFLNENVWTPINFSLKFIPKGPIDNIIALVQIMACCRRGNKPFSGPMMVWFTDPYTRHLLLLS